ncbi:KIAA1430-like [Phytophthora infestans]|uniref:KIAA1430-like n=1 Tax=Phytophthora infestans TaxID=4787 RepID=A0A833SSG6_PHYIN|nr:KIAA1430-like [Phytophthora infestans]KAF4141804.1 hypothetical protein GN958_ATG09049 [Phytophthora infestans]
MTKPRRSLAYSAEYEFGDDNILTLAYFEENRVRNQRRIKHAHSVIDTEAGIRTVNNAKKLQQEQDREIEIAQHNQLLLDRLERIHKKLPKQFDVSHHTQEHLGIQSPSNYSQWQREQKRIAKENEKMRRRIEQTKSMFNTKQLTADADKYLYYSEKLSKIDRRMHLKEKWKQLSLQPSAKRGNSDSLRHSPSKSLYGHKQRHQRTIEGIPLESRRDANELPRLRAKSESKYAAPAEIFPTVTNTSKLVQAADLLPRLGL